MVGFSCIIVARWGFIVVGCCFMAMHCCFVGVGRCCAFDGLRIANIL